MVTESESEKTPVAANSGAVVDSPKVDTSVTDDAIKNSHRPGRISKYIEQMQSASDGPDPDDDGDVKAAATKGTEPQKTEEKPPCKNCGKDGKPLPAVKPEARQAIATLPMPDGTRKPFYSAEEIEDHWEKMSEGRKGLTPGELRELMGQPQPDDKKNEEDDTDLDLLDPALKREILRSRNLEKRLNAIEGQARSREQTSQLDAIKSQIAEAIPEIRKAHVFDDVVDDSEGGLGNVTEKIYGGVVAFLSNDDVMNKRKQKPIKQYFEDAAKVVAHFQGKLKSPATEMTSATLREKHPKVYEEIAQQAVVDYLKTKKDVPPTISGSSSSDNLISKPDDGKAKGFGGDMGKAIAAWARDTL
jgi:hypothetical protein